MAKRVEPEVLSVTQVTRQIKDVLEGNFPEVWVAGEISNLTRAGSGHLYFTLKDERAQLRAVMWRGTSTRLKFEVYDGLDVVAGGPIEIYEARGTYQLTVEHLLPRGVGALELAFRQLCEKLQGEGLFAAERKRPLPRFPRRIALITSPSGAAVRDMLQVLLRRWPSAQVVILPVAVQGAGAAAQIAAALRYVHRLAEVDVVITGRGGGSLEDLWAFNEEVVARAIAECPIPVVSAVGHEIDVTIADFVADRRALTPSEAAELVIPHFGELLSELQRYEQRLVSGLRQRAVQARAVLDGLATRRALARPHELLHELSQRLDDSEQRLLRGMRQQLDRARHRAELLTQSLDALSPLRVLDRGYSLTRTLPEHHVVRDETVLRTGELLETLLPRTRIVSRVEHVEPRR